MLFAVLTVGDLRQIAHQHVYGGAVDISKRNAVFYIRDRLARFP